MRCFVGKAVATPGTGEGPIGLSEAMGWQKSLHMSMVSGVHRVNGLALLESGFRGPERF